MDLGLQGNASGHRRLERYWPCVAEAFLAEGCDAWFWCRATPVVLAMPPSSLDIEAPLRCLQPICLKASERERLAATHGAADILVNNAGAIPGGGLLDMTMERWQEAWNLKVFGYIH